MTLLAKDTQPASIKINNVETLHATSLQCLGTWTLGGITALQGQVDKLTATHAKKVTLDGSQITHMDMGGAWLLYNIIARFEAHKAEVTLKGFTKDQQILLSLTEKQAANVKKTIKEPRIPFLERVGRKRVHLIEQALIFFAFIGEVVMSVGDWLKQPKLIQWRAIMQIIESTGYRALPLVGVLSVLIGVVLAYQMGLQLKDYGANIFIVNLLGLAMLREFAPLMTAIIIAGRSGSAFTAQLGTMQINEEIDALRTMGIAPVGRLVLPKLWGLIIALPLLTVWSDITGILGGMIMSKNMLDISFHDFLSRFQEVTKLKTYIIGLAKAPLFAMIIACVGCYQGFQVHGSANSVGEHTTRSVVQAIFLIIATDALISVLLSWYKI